MSVSFSEVLEVKNSLRQQYIAVSDEWIEACIEFLKQEQNHLPNLKKSVYQQWLLADLEEIACASLPPQLPIQQKITLQNSFALQVQGIRDVSKPAYSQLKDLEGTANSNAEYSSAPQTSIPEWEAKPTRMLMLNLTDGCIQIQGMEYRTIHCLSPNLHPGIKILIKGPVDCRFGVLLLQPENVRILGGEVETKLVPNSRENMLRLQLQIPIREENLEGPPLNSPNPANSVSEAANSLNPEALHPPNRSISASNQNIPNRNPRSASQAANSASSNAFRRNASSDMQNSNHSAPFDGIVLDDEDTPDLIDNFGDDDDFEQNLDYDAIDEIENTQRHNDEANAAQPDQDELDIWEEDADVVREIMEFQDQDIAFEMPFEAEQESRGSDSQPPVFTYLSSVSDRATANCVIIIKGFIMQVLSKLECTQSNGWTLLVKVNDGTATIDVSISDKVLEKIIGVSAQDMLEKKKLAGTNPNVRKEVSEAISNCRNTLQNLNCLMDIQFRPGETPSIIKFSEVSFDQLQQILQRARYLV